MALFRLLLKARRGDSPQKSSSCFRQWKDRRAISGSGYLLLAIERDQRVCEKLSKGKKTKIGRRQHFEDSHLSSER